MSWMLANKESLWRLEILAQESPKCALLQVRTDTLAAQRPCLGQQCTFVGMTAVYLVQPSVQMPT
jgi:hypothetical protein